MLDDRVIINWHLEPRILYVQYPTLYNNENAIHAIHQSVKVTQDCKLPVHVLIDFTNQPEIDIGIREALQTDEIKTQFNNPKFGWMVRIAQAEWHYYYLFTSLLQTRLNAKTHLSPCIGAAMEFLRDADPTLNMNHSEHTQNGTP